MTLPNTVDDFKDPETPRSYAEFYRMYYRDSKEFRQQISEIVKSTNEDRDDFVTIVDSIKDSLAKQASCIDSLDMRIKPLEKLPDKFDTLNIKNNWFAGINATLTTAMGILLQIISKNQP